MPSIEDDIENKSGDSFILCSVSYWFDCEKKSKEGVITLVACDS